MRAIGHVRPQPTVRRAGEDGSSLIMAMAFVTVVMLIVVSLLAFANVGSRSVDSFQHERNRRYAVESSLQAAIDFVADQPRMGETINPQHCGLQYSLNAFSGVVWPGAYLLVECEATPPTLAGGSSGGLDGTGHQRARDVTFTVTCNSGDPAYPTTVDDLPAGDPNRERFPRAIVCGSGSHRRVLATSRVRYEIDYSAANPAARAMVPKIVTWELRG